MLEASALETLRRYFEHRQGITAVYLFGSTVKGVGRKGSDLDLAVLFAEGLDQYHRFQEKLQVASELELLTGRPVDIVDLASSDLYFVHQVMKNKLLVFERRLAERVAFEVGYRKRFFDHLPIHQRFHQQSLKRLRERR